MDIWKTFLKFYYDNFMKDTEYSWGALCDGKHVFVSVSNGLLMLNSMPFSARGTVFFLQFLYKDKEIIDPRNFQSSQKIRLNEIETTLKSKKLCVTIKDKISKGKFYRKISVNDQNTKIILLYGGFGGLLSYVGYTHESLKGYWHPYFGKNKGYISGLGKDLLEIEFSEIPKYGATPMVFHDDLKIFAPSSIENALKLLKKVVEGKLNSHWASFGYHLIFFDKNEIVFNIKLPRTVKKQIGYSIWDDVDKTIINMFTNDETGLTLTGAHPDFLQITIGNYSFTWARDYSYIFPYLDPRYRRLAIRNLRKMIDKYGPATRFTGTAVPDFYDIFAHQKDCYPDLAYIFANYGEIEYALKILEMWKKAIKDAPETIDPWETFICDHMFHYVRALDTYMELYRKTEDESFLSEAKRIMKTIVDKYWRGDHFVGGILRMATSYNYGFERKEFIDSSIFFMYPSAFKLAEFIDELNEKLIAHLEFTLFGDKDVVLLKRAEKITGVIRFRGDRWKENPKGEFREKIWSITSLAATEALLLAYQKTGEKKYYKLAVEIFRFFKDKVQLAEQYYDDGTPSSTRPLIWAHAMRLRVKDLFKDILIKNL